MRVGLSARLDPKRKKESDRTGHGLKKQEVPALEFSGHFPILDFQSIQTRYEVAEIRTA